jgi:hypothetical protein
MPPGVGKCDKARTIFCQDSATPLKQGSLAFHPTTNGTEVNGANIFDESASVKG